MVARNEVGLTFTELTIVMVLAALVMTGLITFYLNSQQMWLDGSSQALTQRDATLVLERMTAETRYASSATVISNPDSVHQMLILFNSDGTQRCQFVWNTNDSLIHLQVGPALTDKGPIASSRVDTFQLDTDGKVVVLHTLAMMSTTRQPVQLSSTMALYNR